MDGRSSSGGLDPEVGVMQGIIQSFYDAPGIVTEGEDGELFVVPEADGRRNSEK